MNGGMGLTRLPVLGLLGVVLIVLGTSVYSYELSTLAIPSPGAVRYLISAAQVYFVLLIAAIALVLYDALRTVRERILQERDNGIVPLSPTWMIPHVLSKRRYRNYFVVSAIVYGIFYAVITSMVVYQPTVNFAEAYGVTIPSAQVIPIRASPLFSPVVTVYAGDHVGLLFVPLTVLLLVATSVLVGLNFSLARFAFDSRTRGVGRGWVGGIGAVVGLFTGCPTCAGLFFANFLGGAGAVSFATILGYYQPVFVLLSIPVLLVTPFMISRSLSKVFNQGCVVLAPRS
jgi:hypothetical protein